MLSTSVQQLLDVDAQRLCLRDHPTALRKLARVLCYSIYQLEPFVHIRIKLTSLLCALRRKSKTRVLMKRQVELTNAVFNLEIIMLFCVHDIGSVRSYNEQPRLESYTCFAVKSLIKL